METVHVDAGVDEEVKGSVEQVLVLLLSLDGVVLDRNVGRGTGDVLDGTNPEGKMERGSAESCLRSGERCGRAHRARPERNDSGLDVTRGKSGGRLALMKAI